MTYKCIFDVEQECSVKEEYKLTPESLNEFCKICSKSSSKKQEAKILEMVAQIAGRFLADIMNAVKEKEELQYRLGRAEATAKIFEEQLLEASHKTS